MQLENGLQILLQAFMREGVRYVLIGGHAVRLNGFVRATEDIDVLLPCSVENGERVIKALNFLAASQELEAEWFSPPKDAPENIRIADDLLIDLLFAANGETYESLEQNIKTLQSQGIDIKVLDIEGLLKTKTDYREKDLIDKLALNKLKEHLKSNE